MKEYKDSVVYRIVRPLIKVLVKLLYRPKFIGLQNIPMSGRVVLAGTHTHNHDCVILMSSTKRSVHFLAKKELFDGTFGFLFKSLNLIPVDRSRKDPNALSSAIDYLNHDALIGIFPEGTTEKVKNELLEFKYGALKMAHETNSLIIPFAITGDYKLFTKNLKIKYGEPFKVSDDLTKSKEQLEKIVESLRKEIL